MSTNYILDTTHKAALGLGTAQFGSSYGVTNTTGQVALNDIREIVAGAALYGITTIDTAAAYGNSEEMLGLTLPVAQPWEIVTKTLPRMNAGGQRVSLNEITSRFEQSLSYLKRSAIDTLLVHRADDLLDSEADELYSLLTMLKYSGRVKKIGISVYRASEIDDILARFPIDVIQLPFNAIDQRLLKSGHLAGLKAAGIEIHVRSAFLQGTLLIDPSLLPLHLKELAEPLRALHQKWRTQGMDLLSGALSEIVFRPEIDRVIVGVTNPGEWLAIIRAFAGLKTPVYHDTTAINNEQLLDPSQWGKLATAVHGG